MTVLMPKYSSNSAASLGLSEALSCRGDVCEGAPPQGLADPLWRVQLRAPWGNFFFPYAELKPRLLFLSAAHPPGSGFPKLPCNANGLSQLQNLPRAPFSSPRPN